MTENENKCRDLRPRPQGKDANFIETSAFPSHLTQ